MATNILPTPTVTKTAHAINILSLIAALLPVAEGIINAYAKTDKTRNKVSTITGTASQIIPIVTGVLSASQSK